MLSKKVIHFHTLLKLPFMRLFHVLRKRSKIKLHSKSIKKSSISILQQGSTSCLGTPRVSICCFTSLSPLPVWGVGDDSFCLPNRSSTAFTNSGLVPSAFALWYASATSECSLSFNKSEYYYQTFP